MKDQIEETISWIYLFIDIIILDLLHGHNISGI